MKGVGKKRSTHSLRLGSGLELGLAGSLVRPALLQERLGDSDLLEWYELLSCIPCPSYPMSPSSPHPIMLLLMLHPSYSMLENLFRQ